MSHPLGKSEQVGQVIAIFECFTVHIRFYQDRLVVKALPVDFDPKASRSAAGMT
jgi:hypothetical protein